MSNIVKYPFVNLQGKEARTVSYEKPGAFTPMDVPKKVIVRDAEEVEKELEEGFTIEEIYNIARESAAVKVGGDDADMDRTDSFQEGLEVTHLDAELEEMKEQAEEEAGEIVEAARSQADEIIVEARRQADDVRAQAHEEGFEAGREEGLQAGAEEINQVRQQVEEERQALQNEYEGMVATLEPQFVHVVGELMEKLTGVVMESNQELILHLIKTGLADVRKNAERIVVRVSSDDAFTAEAHKKEFLESVGEGVTVDIQPQEGMERNECIIETDSQMLDAGIHTQLENLLMSLKMLV